MADGKPRRIARRTALRTWVAGSASLTLLAVSGSLPDAATLAAPSEQPAGPAPVQVPSDTPSPSDPSGGPIIIAPPAPSVGPIITVPPAAATTTGPTSAPAAVPMCIMTPEQTEGPYYIDVDLLRSDITEGKEGLPLRLDLTVLNAASCQPLANATVELWHCDAAGDYSGFSSALPDIQGEPPGSDSGNPPPRPGGPGGPPSGGPGGPRPGGPGGPPPGGAPSSGPQIRNTPTNDLVFLRGGQMSDDGGRVTFQTIYPGWYRGRTVHIHVKVHVAGEEVHTSQLYFDDSISDKVFTQPPYSAHPNRDTMNATDNIFQNGGTQGLAALTSDDSGYIGTLTLGVQV